MFMHSWLSIKEVKIILRDWKRNNMSCYFKRENKNLDQRKIVFFLNEIQMIIPVFGNQETICCWMRFRALTLLELVPSNSFQPVKSFVSGSLYSCLCFGFCSFCQRYKKKTKGELENPYSHWLGVFGCSEISDLLQKHWVVFTCVSTLISGFFLGWRAAPKKDADCQCADLINQTDAYRRNSRKELFHHWKPKRTTFKKKLRKRWNKFAPPFNLTLKHWFLQLKTCNSITKEFVFGTRSWWLLMRTEQLKRVKMRNSFRLTNLKHHYAVPVERLNWVGFILPYYKTCIPIIVDLLNKTNSIENIRLAFQ